MNSPLKNGTKTQEPQRLLGFLHTYRSWIQCTMLFSAQKQAGQEQGVRPVCMRLIDVTGKRQGKFRRGGNLKRRVFCGFGGDFCHNIRICSHKKASRRIDLPFSSVDCPDFIKQWGSCNTPFSEYDGIQKRKRHSICQSNAVHNRSAMLPRFHPKFGAALLRSRQ